MKALRGAVNSVVQGKCTSRSHPINLPRTLPGARTHSIRASSPDVLFERLNYRVIRRFSALYSNFLHRGICSKFSHFKPVLQFPVEKPRG